MSTFIVAKTTPTRFAMVTGLVRNKGFVLYKGLPGGLYGDDQANRINEQLIAARINHHIVSADSVKDGLRKVFGE